MKPTPVLTPHFLNSLQPRAKEFTLPDPQCVGLRLRVQPNGSKSWVCSLRKNGCSRRLTLGTWPDMSVDAARVAMLTTRLSPSEHESSDLPPTTSQITFAEVCAQFCDTHMPSYKPATRKPITIYLNAQLLPAFGTYRMQDLTPAVIAEWFHRYARTRPGGANQALAHFTTIFNWAKDHDLISASCPNPAAPIRKNRRQAPGRMLTRAQLIRLGEAMDSYRCRNHNSIHAIRLILLTGCRKKEILSLRWSDVTKTKIKLQDAKTGPRDVYLSEIAQHSLKDLKRLTGHTDFLFPSPRSASGHLESITDTWAMVKTCAGLPTSLRLHDLRHTYASHAILSGESLSVTGRLLGHTSPKSTEIYTHLDGATLAKCAEKVGKVISQLLRCGP